MDRAVTSATTTHFTAFPGRESAKRRMPVDATQLPATRPAPPGAEARGLDSTSPGSHLLLTRRFGPLLLRRAGQQRF